MLTIFLTKLAGLLKLNGTYIHLFSLHHSIHNGEGERVEAHVSRMEYQVHRGLEE